MYIPKVQRLAPDKNPFQEHSSFNSPSFDAFIIAFDICVTLSTRNRLAGRVLRSLQEERSLTKPGCEEYV
ncbi:hypothetical protein M758_9G083900 [Ceratodon purpureus]|nr:hypothetical protein M758_9G083900 [Ceratodon purpureus]